MNLKSQKAIAQHRLMILDGWAQLMQSGYDSATAATTLGYSVSTLKEWKRRFDQKGIDGLYPCHRTAASRESSRTKAAIEAAHNFIHSGVVA